MGTVGARKSLQDRQKVPWEISSNGPLSASKSICILASDWAQIYFLYPIVFLLKENKEANF